MSVPNTELPDTFQEVERRIASVLQRAHREAEDQGQPDEARAILVMAHQFADQLAKDDPNFNRQQFIEAATRDPS